MFKWCTLLILFDGRRGLFYNLLEAVRNFLHLGPGTNNINYKGSLGYTTFGSNSGIKTKWNYIVHRESETSIINHRAEVVGNVRRGIKNDRCHLNIVHSNLKKCCSILICPEVHISQGPSVPRYMAGFQIYRRKKGRIFSYIF